MNDVETPEKKEVKILKCLKCGKEYIYDSTSKYCPECHGALEKATTYVG